MPAEYRADLERPEPDHTPTRLPDRLGLTPAERANLRPDALALVSPLLTRDPAKWTLDEVRAVAQALDATPQPPAGVHSSAYESAQAVRSRLLNLGRPLVRAHEDQYRPLADEVRRINDELVSARRRPNSTTSTISRQMARLHVDRMIREAGVAAREAERERWFSNPGDPRARTAMQAAHDQAVRELELRRPQLEDAEYRKDESERVKRHNARNSALHDRKASLVRGLRDAHVTVPEEPRELVNP